MKRIVPILIVCFMVLGIFSACSGGAEKNKDVNDKINTNAQKVEITYMQIAYMNESVHKKVIEAFEKENPNIKVNFIQGPDGENYSTLFETKAAANEAPDVFMYNNYPWLEKGLIMYIDDVMDAPAYRKDSGKFIDTFYQCTHEFMKYDGHYFGIPYDLWFDGIIWYNKDIFSKNNIQIPNTWEEFLNICERLKQNGIAPLAQSNFGPYANQWYKMIVLRTMGNNAVKDTLSPFRKAGNSFNSDEFLNAAKILYEFSNKGYFMNGWQGTSFQDAQIQFAQGKAAMLHTGNWIIGELKDIITEESPIDFFKFPVFSSKYSGGDDEALTGGTNIICISSNTKHRDESIEFLKFLGSTGYNIMAKETGLIFGSKVAGEGVPYKKWDLRSLEILEKTSTFSSWNWFPDWAPNNEIANAFNDGLLQLMMNKISPDKFVESHEDILKKWENEKK